MSLSSWFKEYVYIPLGGNKKGLPRQLANILIVWILTGLWHGASWNFVAWGIYYGIILIAEKLCILKVLKKCPPGVGHVYSIVIIVIGWVIFAVDDLSEAIRSIGMMFGSSGNLTDTAFSYFLESRIWLIIACAIGSTPLVRKVCGIISKRLRERYILLGVVETVFLMAIFAFSMAFLVSGSYNPFLYFRF